MARIEVDRYGWDGVGNMLLLMSTELFLSSGDVWTVPSKYLLAAKI
ncbi:hypothetical protein [Massilia psychrophila]|nr:hypothetical protein [Massilia psychrophila]GGE79681.1 hypothetical protein GCM10008020_25560 [Massilia psychrophila]